MTTNDPNEIERRVIDARDTIDRQMDDTEDYLAVHIANRMEDMPLRTMAKAAKLLSEGQGFTFIRPHVIEGQAEGPAEIEGDSQS